jgi:N-acetyl-anhydromuramyl-L-alanine amidase AmpD
MEGTLPGTDQWFQTGSQAAGDPVSAHYGVGRNGEIHKYVLTTKAAWHAGRVNSPTAALYDKMGKINPNLYTVGIEHEGHWKDGLTEAQYQATLWLQRQIIKAWGIPVDREHILGHYEFDSINRARCPGPHFPFERLLKDLAL